MTFTCQRCGTCCRDTVINISYSDIVRWFQEKRHGILFEVTYLDNYPTKGTGGFYFLKTVRNPKRPCPFLKGNNCDIQKTKPLACKDAPFGYESFSMCPAFEGAKREIRVRFQQVVDRQRKDFFKAFTQRKFLMTLLKLSRQDYGNARPLRQ